MCARPKPLLTMALSMEMFTLEDGGQYHVVKATPPQTQEAEVPPVRGAYCFVIDVSGSCVLTRPKASSPEFILRLTARPPAAPRVCAA